MKITKLTVVTEDGQEKTWVGEGFISPERTQSKAGPKHPLVVGVDAHINWVAVKEGELKS